MIRFRPFRNWSFAARVSLTIMLPATLILGGIFGLIHFRFSRLADREIDRAALLAAELAAERINRVFPMVTAAANGLAAALRSSAEPLSEDRQAELLAETFRSLRETVPALCGISIVCDPRRMPGERKDFMIYVYSDEKGVLRQIRRGGEDDSCVRLDRFVIPKLLDRSIWSEPYFNRVANTMTTTYSQILRGPAGEFVGVAGFDLSLKQLNELAEHADAYGFGQEIILSRFGRIIAYPDNPGERRSDPEFRREVGDSTLFSYADSLEHRFLGRDDTPEQLRAVGTAMLRGKSGTAVFPTLSPLTGGRERLYYAPIAAPGWSLAVSYPEEQLTGHVVRLERNLRWLSVVGILLISLTVLVITRRQTAPLARLTKAANAIGSGNFHAELPSARDGGEIGQLTAAFDSMQQALARYTAGIQTDAAARQKAESELETARGIQRGMLPKELPRSEFFSLHAELLPAQTAGAGFYDVFLPDEFRCCFMIGDVSGKGVPAALFMSAAQTLLRSEAERFSAPGELATRINTLLSCRNDALMFVAFFFGVLDLRTGRLEYCNAGHRPPCVVRNGGEPEELTAGRGPALGVMENHRYSQGATRLAAGETVVLYSDGVAEALDPEMRESGAETLRKLLERSAGSAPEAVCGEILRAANDSARGAERAGDITLLLVKFLGNRPGNIKMSSK